MGKHIFICHSTHDGLIAEKVRQALESRGIRCWMAPQDIPPGAEWAEAIVDAVDNSSGVVLILSSNSNSSPQVIREIGRAVSRNVSIVPFRIDDTPLSRSMEYFLSTHQWLDALEPPLEKHFQKLSDTVQRLLDREAVKEKTRQEVEAAQAKGETEETRKAQEAARAKKKAEEARRAKEAERVAREREKKEAEEAAKEKAARARREAARAEVPAGAGKRIIKSVWLWVVVVVLVLAGSGVFIIPWLTTEQPSSTPTLTSPGTDSEPGPVLDDLIPTLQWGSVSDADYYALTISKYPYGSENIIYYKQVTGTLHFILGGTLAGGERYCWNVQAHGPSGLSAVSNTLYFQTPSVPPSPLSGYVREAGTNAPISGANIVIWDYSSIETTSWIWCGTLTTNSEGYYDISKGWFSLPPGTYAIRAEAEGYASKWFNNAYTKQEATPLLITGSGERTANFTLEVGGSISGKVIADASGSGIYNLHVYAEDYSTHGWATGVFTEIDGTYTMHGLPAGTYRVIAIPWINGQPYAVEYYDNTTNYNAAKAVTVKVGQDTPDINFSLASTAP